MSKIHFFFRVDGRKCPICILPVRICSNEPNKLAEAVKQVVHVLPAVLTGVLGAFQHSGKENFVTTIDQATTAS